MATALMVRCEKLATSTVRTQMSNWLVHQRHPLEVCKTNQQSWRCWSTGRKSLLLGSNCQGNVLKSSVKTSLNKLQLAPRNSPCLQRHFHTSSNRRALPFLPWLAVKSILKAAAIASGRTLRNRWKRAPRGEHKTAWERLHHNRFKIAAGLAGFTCFCIGYYYYHIDYAPFTNRPRFMVFNDSQFLKIVDSELEVLMEEYEKDFVPVTHPIFLVIADVVMKLMKGNADVPQIRNQTWTIHVVNKNIKNAFVLPNGHIFVFAGILQATENTEQLGSVLAHEMAHVVLSHSAETLSFVEFIDFFVIVVLTALWAFLPNDGLAIVATWFKNKVVKLLIHMPYNRNIETEADEVGLVLAARSCFDVRESKAFWESMEAQQTQEGEGEVMEWLSTHPSHQTRATHLATLIPGAIDLRKYCNCPPLPPSPRLIASKSEPPADTSVAAA